ncbi:carbon monoxide dehydrogenase [Rummeliibacillus pycnus]|uniref:carbon monoxide dehydrogenase n=1 Tax=Rummeliibacillus pycnus TaxID=101070 RepID=UPI003D2E8ECF
MITIISIIILFSAKEEIYANQQNTPLPPSPSFEEKFAEAGYKSVEESVKEFENYFNCDVKLPRVTPAISFTHRFGSFYEDKRYNTNHSLDIRYVNKDVRENIYKIDIRPIKNKLNFKGKEGKEYTLQDGGKAFYFESHQFNFLVFEKNDLQYLLGIYREVTNVEMPNTLVRIANSVE